MAMICVFMVLLLTGCSSIPTSSAPVPTASAVAPSLTPTLLVPTATPAPAAATLPIEPNRTWTLAEGLTIEEYALLEAPSTDMAFFQPQQGTMADVLARRATYRSGNSQVQCASVLSCMVTSDNETEFVIENQFNQDGSDGWVRVSQDGVEIYTIQSGPGGPINALRGFWVYEDHWVLETARISHSEQVIDGVHTVFMTPVGQISQDGKLLNTIHQYDEMFGYQRIAGKPFYFYQQDGKINISFNGATAATEYDAIPHYGCCSAGMLNPRPYTGSLAFYAQREGTWYYVELGVFD